VRNHFGKSIRVSSFFRSAALNVAIGGSKSSQHVKGQALDMDNDGTSGPSNKQIFEYIRDNVKFDQLIVEGINDGVMAWVHCSYSTLKNRGEILFMYTANGKKVYEAYSPARYKALIK
jgi:zinc D-Ala-D-Ala carboxypeptidase